MFGLEMNSAQKVGLLVVAADLAFIAFTLSNRQPVSNRTFETFLVANSLFIGYGFGRKRDIQVKFIDTRFPDDL